MRIVEILNGYGEEALQRLAVDKVDEVAGLRLPHAVWVQEIAAALSSLSYVAAALAPTRPPTYAFLKLLLEAEDHAVPVEGFRERVLQRTEEWAHRAERGDGLSAEKNYALYLEVLHAAWEDGRVDRSEERLLEALRRELGIWTREHLLLEHHPRLQPAWNGEYAFEDVRDHLLATGLVLRHEEGYVLADEVRRQVRHAWQIELQDRAYRRLLERLTVQQLHRVLEAMALALSGSKEERVERIVAALTPPSGALEVLRKEELRELARGCNLPLTADKPEHIANLIEYFDQKRDLLPPVVEESPPPPEPEPRQLDETAFITLFQRLTGDQLQDILAARQLRRSGSKGERIARLAASPWSERTLLGGLRRAELATLCRGLGLTVSGLKEDLLDRLLAWREGPSPEEASPDEVIASPVTRETLAEPEAARPAEPPTGLYDIRADYPQLDSGEQVILALLKEARSLSEGEIERAARRHRLGWFLTKAHMADLLARLERAGGCPLRVRSGGGINLYEWAEARPANGSLPERGQARDLVDALRHGVVPERHLEILMVGQEAPRKHLVDLLRHAQSGRTEFKFIRGSYGAGKSFLCAWLREQAFRYGFATATVRIGPDQPLSDLPLFFAGLVDGLRTAEKRDACALADILESWLLAIHRRTAQLEGIDADDEGAREALAPMVVERIGEELARLADRESGLAPALQAFYRAHLAHDLEAANAALAWLRGSRDLPAETMRRIGVRGHLEADRVFPRLRALLDIVAGGRFNGLVLLVDELDLVRRFPHARQREQAYETLRQLIDECGENRLPRCLMLFTGTDEFFDDARYGVPSHAPLAHRVSAPAGVDGVVSMRQPVIVLEGLDRGRLLSVAKRVRHLHGDAYGWAAAERVGDPLLERIAERWTQFGGERVNRLPRPFLRELVHLLDLCEENPELDPAECIRPPEEAEEAARAVFAVEF